MHSYEWLPQTFVLVYNLLYFLHTAVLALAFSHIWLTCNINLAVRLSVVGFNESNFYFYFYTVSCLNCWLTLCCIYFDCLMSSLCTFCSHSTFSGLEPQTQQLSDAYAPVCCVSRPCGVSHLQIQEVHIFLITSTCCSAPLYSYYAVLHYWW